MARLDGEDVDGALPSFTCDRLGVSAANFGNVDKGMGSCGWSPEFEGNLLAVGVLDGLVPAGKDEAMPQSGCNLCVYRQRLPLKFVGRLVRMPLHPVVDINWRPSAQSIGKVEEEGSSLVILIERDSKLVLFRVEATVHDSVGGRIGEPIKVASNALTPPFISLCPSSNSRTMELLHTLVHALDDILLNGQKRVLAGARRKVDDHVARVFGAEVVVVDLNDIAEDARDKADVDLERTSHRSKDADAFFDGIGDTVDDLAIPRFLLPMSRNLVQTSSDGTSCDGPSPGIAAGTSSKILCTLRKRSFPDWAAERLAGPPFAPVNLEAGEESRGGRFGDRACGSSRSETCEGRRSDGEEPEGVDHGEFDQE